MADSEIDTIVSASKLDFGMFDDLLRKAFHHERVASSRKTDNELIRIDARAWRCSSPARPDNSPA